MTFDQAQSPRLGQTVAPELPGIQVVDLANLPEVARTGQIIYLEDTSQFAVYFDGAWVTPNAGVQTFVAPVEPLADNVGDLWLSTISFQLKVWNGTIWVTVVDPEGTKIKYNAADALYTVVGAPINASFTIYSSTSAPASPSNNDFWFNPNTNVTQKRVTGVWVLASGADDTAVQNAVLTSSTAIDGQVKFYRQLGAPTGLSAQNEGDVWRNITTGVTYRWNGGGWVSIADGLAMAQSAVGIDQISSTQLKADAITAKHTLTGPVIRTAASGNRMEIRDDSAGGVIWAYSGVAGEDPGYIDPGVSADGRPNLVISSGRKASPAFDNAGFIRLNSSAGPGAYIIVNDDPNPYDIALGGTTNVVGDLHCDNTWTNRLILTTPFTGQGVINATTGVIYMENYVSCNGSLGAQADVTAGGAMFCQGGFTTNGGIFTGGGTGLITSGTVIVQGIASAGAAAANTVCNGSGELRRISSSAAKYKENFRDPGLDADAMLDAIDTVLFDYKEEHGGFTDVLGVRADDAVGTALNNFVVYDWVTEEDGSTTWTDVEAFDYGRAGFMLAHTVGKAQRARIEELETRVAALEAALADMTASGD